MKHVSVSLEDLLNHPETEKVIKETVDDRLLYREGLEILSHSQLYQLLEGEEVIGFFTVDEEEDSVDVHAYLYPEFRKYSLKALRHIISSQTKTITTSVYGTHLHVCNFLTRKGFKVTDIEFNALIKNGKPYHVWNLTHFKENSNG